MLGRDVVDALDGRDVTGFGRQDLDVTDRRAVEAAVPGYDVVVNAAAWTAVDDAESKEGQAFDVNAVGAATLAAACAASGAWLVHVSTDYVFGGKATVPYPEDAPVAPRSAYGRTKAAGEWAVLAHLAARAYVVRTAWLYGAHGANFVRTVARLESERATLDAVDDQRGQPTWSRDVALRLRDLVDARGPAGIYHATSSGETTWHGLAQRVFTLLGADPRRVRATTSARFGRPAPRPAYSVLGQARWALAGLPPMRTWDAALTEAHAAGVLGRSP